MRPAPGGPGQVPAPGSTPLQRTSGAPVRPQAFRRHIFEHINRNAFPGGVPEVLTEALAAANELERLRLIIAGAPHGEWCKASWGEAPCRCWKANALATEDPTPTALAEEDT